MAIRVADFHAKAVQAAQQQGYLAIERRGGEDRLVIRGTSWFGRLFGALRPGRDSRSVIEAYRAALQREHPGVIGSLPYELRSQLDGTQRVRAARLIQATGANGSFKEALFASAREKRGQLLDDVISPRMGAAITGALQRLQAAGELGLRDLQTQELDPALLHGAVRGHLKHKNLRSDALDASAEAVVREYALQRRPLFEAIDRRCAGQPAEIALYRAYAARPDAAPAVLDGMLAAGAGYRQQFTQCLQDIASSPHSEVVEAAAERLLTLLQQPVVAQLQGDLDAGTQNSIAGPVLAAAVSELASRGVTAAQLYGRLLGSATFMGGMAVYATMFGASGLNPGYRILAGGPYNTLQHFGNTLQEAARAAGAEPPGSPAFNTLFDDGTPVMLRFTRTVGAPDGVERADLVDEPTRAVAARVLGARFPLRSADELSDVNRVLAAGCDSASVEFAAYIAEKALLNPGLNDSGSALSVALRRVADETLPERLASATSIDSGQGEAYAVFEATPELVRTLMRQCLDEMLKQAGGVA